LLKALGISTVFKKNLQLSRTYQIPRTVERSEPAELWLIFPTDSAPARCACSIPFMMKTRFLPSLLCALVLGLSTGTAAWAVIPAPAVRAGDYRTVGSGPFNNTSTWERFVNGPSGTAADGYYVPATVVPNSTDGTITIRATHTITVSTAMTLDEVFVEYGAVLEHSGSNSLVVAAGPAAYDFVIQGTYRELSAGSGMSATAGAAVLVDETGTWRHSADGGVIPLAEWSPTSLLLFDGIASATSLTGQLGQEFGRITWNCPLQTSTFALGPTTTQSNAVSTVAVGTFTVISTGSSGRLQLAAPVRSNPVTLYGDFVQTGGRTVVNAAVNSPRSLNVGGEFTLQGGTFAVTAATTTSATGLLQIAGGMHLGGGSLVISQSARPGSIAVGGDVAVASGATLQTTGSGTATFNFLPGPNRLYSNLGTVSGPILFNVNGGATLAFGVHALFGTGTFTLADGAEASFGSPAGITSVGQADQNDGNVRIGTLSPFQRTYSPLAFYEYNGTVPQLTGSGLPTEVGASSATLFAGGLRIANATPVKPSVTLSRPLRLNGDLVLVRGRLISAPSTMLTLSSSAVLASDGPGCDTAYVQGPLAREMDEMLGLYDFPIGDTSAYRPLAMRLADPLGSATYTVTATRPALTVQFAPEALLSTLVGDTRWLVARSAGTTNAIVRLSYDTGMASNVSKLTIAGFNASTNTWEDLGLVARDQTAGWLEAEVLPQYSQVSLALAAEDPLPVELMAFKAERQGSRVVLTWATASEKNSAYFGVERSANGREFTEVARVTAAGNSSQRRDYQTSDDKPLATQSYYRLRQVDTDGSVAYSSIVVVRGGATATEPVRLFPNPATDRVTVQLPAEAAQATVRVINALGQVALLQTASAVSAVSLDLRGLPAGAYTVVVSTPGQPATSQRLLVSGN
jgi:Secretion system C-terminal sorting domain